MPNYISVHFGLNKLDAAHYTGWPLLFLCENDARDMAGIASANGFHSNLFLSQQATSARLLGVLRNQADQLVMGDRLILTFAGHGSLLPDTSQDEPDGLDEAWCCYDRIVRDDEIFYALSRFRAGVKVLVVADSCYSGSSIRFGSSERALTQVARHRYYQNSAARTVLNMHRSLYDAARFVTPRITLNDLRCSAILLSACQDNQVALEDGQNGLFTATLKRVWSGGRFAGTYRDFIARIRAQMPSYQIPGLLALGAEAAQFAVERPFHF